MNYAKVIFCDIANGIGCRTSLFVSGCNRHCKDCFNQQAWDFNYGDLLTEDIIEKIINSLKFDYIAGLSILGGEPLELDNRSKILDIILKVRNECPNKTIWIYSGYTYEELKNMNDKIINDIIHNIDVLVDGAFEVEKKDISLAFRGSSNQRIIDIKESIINDKIILMEF